MNGGSDGLRAGGPPNEVRDVYERRIARFLIIVAAVASTGVAGFCVLTLIFAPEPTYTYVLAGAYFACACSVVVAARAGRIKLACHLFVITNLIPATLFLLVEGPHTGHFGVLFIVVIMAGMLLRGRATVVYGALAVFAFAASYGAARLGFITSKVPATDAVWAQHLSQLIVASVVTALLGSSLHRALADLRVRERELEASERKHARLVNHSPDGILFLDNQGTIASANLAAAELFAMPVDELAGKSLTALGFDADQVGELDRLTVIGEHEVETAAGSLVLELNGCSIEEAGEVLGVELIVRDVTKQHAARDERSRLEANLRQAQRLESLGRLAGGVAHDFNNLLTVIIGNVEFITLEERLAPRSSEALDEVTDAARRAASVTRQLLTFGRAPDRKPQPIDLGRTLRLAERLFRRFLGERVELVVDVSGDPTFVVMSPPQLDQVIMNLVLNAQDAMPRGGRLSIAVDVVPQDDGTRCVCLSVADDGEGMCERVKGRLFEPFFSTKEEGDNTGLGLSVVKQIVDEAGGDISVDSEEGSGTTFVVLLPEAPAPAEIDSVPADAKRDRLSGRVLYVDDDDSVRPAVARMLRSMGLEVASARDGDEAAAELASADGFDVLVTDVVLSHESGRDVAERLRATSPEIGVLYVSGYSAGGLAGVPADAPFLSKPMSRRDLHDKLEPMLATRS
jgi:PAS domain S-box-containing protein